MMHHTQARSEKRRTPRCGVDRMPGTIRIVALVLTVLTVFSSITLADGWADPQQVADVLAGVRTEADAAWWGFDPEDSTRFLQAALDSGASTVVIPRMNTPWITGPLFINRDDLEVFFEPGALVMAKQGEFLGAGDCLFLVQDRTRIVFRGYGATLRMRKLDYIRPPYANGEWRHLISLRGCTDVKILGLSLEESGGDGIYIGTGAQNYCRDIEIRDIVADGNHRQGISVISVENLLIADSVLKRTSGTAPMAGIDFEPNRADQRLVNILLQNVLTENNGFAGYFLWLSNLSSESLPISMRFVNCRSKGDYAGIGLRRMGGSDPVRGLVEFVNTRVSGAQHAALLVEAKCATSSLARFEGCIFSGTRGDASFLFEGGENWGGLEFQNVILEDWEDRPIIAFAGEARMKKVSGTLRVKTPHAESETILSETLRNSLTVAGLQVTAEKADIARPLIIDPQTLPMLQHLHPAGGTQLEVAPDPVLVQYSHAYALFADKEERVALTLDTFQDDKRVELEIVSPSGDVVAHCVQVGPGSRNIAFTAAEGGAYLVAIAAPPYGGGYSSLRTAARLSVLPHVFNQRDTGHDAMIESSGSLYFWVPENTDTFHIQIRGARSEPEEFKLFDPDGRLVAEQDKVTGRQGRTFVVHPESTATGRIWRLLKSGEGRYRVRLFDPLPPVFSCHPNALLIPQSIQDPHELQPKKPRH